MQCPLTISIPRPRMAKGFANVTPCTASCLSLTVATLSDRQLPPVFVFNTASASRSPLHPVPPSVGTTVALLGATTNALVVNIEASLAPTSRR